MSQASRSERPVPPASVAVFPAAQRTDASLVDGARLGERAAFAAIWDRYSRTVRCVVLGALGPDPAIEDLTQDVFLALVKGAAQLRDGAALRGYLAGIAVRLVAQEIRRRRVRRWVGLTPTGELPEQVAMPDDHLGREALSALSRVLDGLSARRRSAYVLRDVVGLEMLEVASALDVSESTLRRELGYARDFVARSTSREPALAEYLTARKEARR